MQYLRMCVCIHNFLCPLHTTSPAYRKGMCQLATSGAGLVISSKQSMY